MSVRDTTILKGIAILFMLYLHLFNQIGNVELCVTHLSVGNTPLVYLFTRCTNPVAFFLLLSGYGLYASYKLGKRDSMRRIGKLYVHYWLTLLIFVPLGWWIRGSEVYPGSWKQILENVSGWYTGYNGEIWFLFPYMLLVLTSVQLFRWMDKVKLIPFFLLAGSLYFFTYVLVYFWGDSYLYTHQGVYILVLYFNLLFPFLLGGIMMKYNIVNKCKIKKEVALALIVLLMLMRMCIATSFFHVFFAAIFIILFMRVGRGKWLDCFLYEMGRRSTSMWFVHTYFCYYLFHDFIYNFKNPLLIFTVLLVFSYISALVIDYLNNKIQKLINLKS